MQNVHSKMAAYAVYSRAIELQGIVGALNQIGFRNDEICLLLAPGHPIAAQMRDIRTLADTSAGLESLVSWLTRLGAVVISNLAFFVRSADYLHALADTPISTKATGHLAALANLGIPESETGRLGSLISNGAGLVFVNCRRTAQSEPALEIFRKTGAEEISGLDFGRLAVA